MSDISQPRLELALERLPPSGWERFEALASQFLAAEYPNLRVTASQSGDGGRDSVLWQPEDRDSVVVQYSIQKDWRSKIRGTAKRLAETSPGASILVYVTNQALGSSWYDLRQELSREFELHLDVRDRSFFLTSANADLARQVASEEFASTVVDPLMNTGGIAEARPSALDSTEAQAACLYLGLQWEDDTREKGLTRLAFEALVKAVLRDTSPEHRLARRAVHAAIRAVLASSHPEDIDRLTDSALARLSKSVVKYYQKEDEFCLSHDERVRLGTRLELREAAAVRIRDEIAGNLQEVPVDVCPPEKLSSKVIVPAAQRLIQEYLFQRGESFAAALTHEVVLDDPAGLDSVATSMGAKGGLVGLDGRQIAAVVACARRVLEDPSGDMQHYFRVLADAYTLYAFLREAPDVQSAMVKMFSQGEVWLDTNVVLRLMAEDLIDNGNRTFQNIIHTGRQAGMKFLVTDGVIEEIEGHTHLCLTYLRYMEQQKAWRGGVPFLFAAYAFTGRDREDFATWLSVYRGSVQPVDDITDYLGEFYGVKVGSLKDDAERAPVGVRGEVAEYWRGVHADRWDSGEVDPEHIDRMIAHDVENYLGVLWKRRRQRQSPYGYTTWWMTLDRAAFALSKSVDLTRRPGEKFHPPTMTPDFLVSYLAVGPMRARISKSSESDLPLMAEIGQLDYVPSELLQLADKVRQRNRGLPEHVVRRMVRDELNAARARIGDIARGGTRGSLRDLEREIKGSAE